MPLPWIIGLAGVVGTAFIGNCAREVNENLANDLNSINNDMEKMQKSTKILVEQTTHEFSQCSKNFFNISEAIGKETMKEFYLIMKEVRKNCKYISGWENQSKYEFLNFELQNYNDNSVYISSPTSVSGDKGIINTSLNLIEGIFLGASAIKGVSLMYKIDDAVAEKKKLKAECKKIEIKCEELKASTRFMNITIKTLKTLKKLTDELNRNTKYMLVENGYRVEYLSEHEYKQLMTMVNYNRALDDIINTKLLDEEGKILPEFKNKLLQMNSDFLPDNG